MSSTRSAQALVEAAVALIAGSGLDGLTLSQVARRARVSRATAYREFGDKEGLIAAVAQHEVGAMISATVAGVDMRADPATIVRSTVLFALRYLRGHEAFTYIRDHEPHWLLNAALVAGDATSVPVVRDTASQAPAGMNLVQTVAALVAPVISAPDDRLALEPFQAAELVVRNVLSHSLIEQSALSDEQVADAMTRAISTR
jgi:AcrR family transcriptional regulator